MRAEPARERFEIETVARERVVGEAKLGPRALEEEFDQIFARIRARELPYWADPRHQRPNQINRNDGGRGLYWNDPSGHYLEILTRPYGSGAG